MAAATLITVPTARDAASLVFTIRPIRMNPITATVSVAGRDIVVHELTMAEIRRLVGMVDSAPPAAPPPEGEAAPLASIDWPRRLMEHRFAIDGVALDHVLGMTTLHPSDFDGAKPSELGALVAKARQLNPFFFELLGPALPSPSSAPEAKEQKIPPPPLPTGSDPLADSLSAQFQGSSA